MAVERIFGILEQNGGDQYDGEAVSQLEHALQCAYLAEHSGAPTKLVVAALLHDIGHLIRVCQKTVNLLVPRGKYAIRAGEDSRDMV